MLPSLTPLVQKVGPLAESLVRLDFAMLRFLTRTAIFTKGGPQDLDTCSNFSVDQFGLPQ